MKKRKIVFLIIGAVLLIGGALIGWRYYQYTYRKVFTMTYNISTRYQHGVDCEITKTAGFYKDTGYYTTYGGLEKGGLKFQFKNLGTDNPTAIISDVVGLNEAEFTKLIESDSIIQLARTWGTENDGIELYTIHKKTGFFSYSKSGDFLGMGAIARNGFGICN